jgi:hypothetical protein
MKYVVEMGPGVMIYLPYFIQIDSGIEKLIRGMYIYRYTESKVISYA